MKTIDELVIEMYNDNISYKNISKKLGYDYTNKYLIEKILKCNNINPKLIRNRVGRKPIDVDFFKKIDSKEKAYVLGLIYSDGSIDNDGYGMTFVSKDLDLITLYKTLLSSEHTITKILSYDKRTNKTYERFQIHISCKEMLSDLSVIGLHNAKSFNCNFPKVPKDLMWHFIRGLFDGDGCIRTTDKIGKLTFSLILSGELYLGIKRFFEKNNLSVTKDLLRHENEKGKIWSIKHSAFKNLKILKDNLYKDSENLRLERKFLIFSTLKEYKKIGGFKSQKIYQYDLNDVLMSEYKDMNELEILTNFNRRIIYTNLNKKTSYTRYGYKFSYEKL